MLLDKAVPVVKNVLLASIVFVGVPYIFVATNINQRLDASIYDYYNFLLLIWLTYRFEDILNKFSKKTDKKLKKQSKDKKSTAQVVWNDKERENLMRLKKKLERRRKK
ncbi:hypothetical protein OAA09_00040 [bacterium]|nr:hypothetical protein [bacterium]